MSFRSYRFSSPDPQNSIARKYEHIGARVNPLKENMK